MSILSRTIVGKRCLRSFATKSSDTCPVEVTVTNALLNQYYRERRGDSRLEPRVRRQLTRVNFPVDP